MSEKCQICVKNENLNIEDVMASVITTKWIVDRVQNLSDIYPAKYD